MNGATILPFPSVPGAAAPGRSNASATGGRLAGPVFSDAMDGALDAPAPLRRDDHGRASKSRLLLHEPRPAEGAKPAAPAARRSTGGARRGSGVLKAGHDDESTHDVDDTSRADRKAGDRDDIAADRDPAVRAARRDADDASAAGPTEGGTDGAAESGTKSATTSLLDGAENAGIAGMTAANVTGVAVLADHAAGNAADVRDAGAHTSEATADGTRTARILRWAGVAAQAPTETSAAQAAKSDTAQQPTVPTDSAAKESTAPSSAQSATAAPDTLAAMIAAAAEAARVRALAQTSASTVVATASEDGPAAEGEPASGAAIEAIEAAPVASEWVAAAIEPRGGAASGSDARQEGESQQRQTPAGRGSEATPFAVAASADGARFTLNVGAASAAYGSAASAGPGREEPVLPQIVQNIRMQASQGVSEARVQLKPEHLGALNITLKIENGQVTATIQAEVPAVRQWIESHESSLRQALLEQGLELNRLVVHPDGEAPSGEGQDQEAPRRQPRRQSWRDESMTFEVIA